MYITEYLRYVKVCLFQKFSNNQNIGSGSISSNVILCRSYFSDQRGCRMLNLLEIKKKRNSFNIIVYCNSPIQKTCALYSLMHFNRICVSVKKIDVSIYCTRSFVCTFFDITPSTSNSSTFKEEEHTASFSGHLQSKKGIMC